MALFDMPTRPGRENDAKLVSKAKSTKKATPTIKSGGGIAGLIANIRSLVDRNLGHLKDEYVIIRDQETLTKYIDTCTNNNVISIDTETTGLDPLRDTLVGICIYTPNEKAAYIPVNHISYITNERVENQLPKDILKQQFDRLVECNTKVIMFNAAFDIRFLRSGIGTYLTCYWDCYIAARLLNENEGQGNNGLKKLHNKYVLDGVGDAFKFDDLFRGITFDKVPINTGYIYAAHDAIITYELYEYQKKYLYYDPACARDDRNGMNGVSWVFFNIEMPIISVVADMEDNGIELDMDYNHELSIKYGEKLKESEANFYNMLGDIQKDIDRYIMNNPMAKLDNPINLASPSQLSILLFDIMGLDAGVDKKTKKPIKDTGEAILKSLDHPICKAILDYRELSKLISTYIDKLPNCVNPKDGRVHCKFNQYGADTGRFSSNDPNLQNIPSHNKDIRKMFKAQDGYVLMSSDFSQQEPKCLAALCRQQGDAQMYDTFMQGKDLYSEIAAKAFNKTYEECREFNPDGTTNKEGKGRRTQAKSILLGVLYGRGVPSIAEQLKCSVDEAQAIKDSVFKGFPAIKQFEETSLDMAHDLGFVTTVCGRKRRLPDLQLPEFGFEWVGGISPIDDPLDFDDIDNSVPYKLQNLYLQKLKSAKFSQKQKVYADAREKHNINIIDNGGKIAGATRQCVNARIQGSAADLTKLAMIELHNSERLKELGFKILIPVHDEIIAECPRENAKECSELLASTMSKAAEQILQMPIKCDVEITERWYGESIEL